MNLVISMGLETIKPCLKNPKAVMFLKWWMYFIWPPLPVSRLLSKFLFTVTNMLSFILILNRLIDDEILKRCPQGLHDKRVQSCVFGLGLVQVMTSLSSRA